MKVILLMQVIVHVCFSTEVYRVPVYYQNHRVIVDLSLNRQDNTLIVSTSTANLPKDFLPSVNFHDFNTSMKAFKNIDNGECFIIRTSETISMVERVLGKILRNNFQQHPIDECLILDTHRLSNDEVEAIAGRRIRKFCSGYKSFTSKSIRRKVASRSDTPDERILLGRRKLGCFICTGGTCAPGGTKAPQEPEEQ